MEASALVGLLDACVSDFESEGISELISQLHDDMPSLLRSRDATDFELVVRCARIIAFSPKPEPLPLAISILLDVGFAHVSRGITLSAIPLVERALDIATDNGLKSELRRACSVYAAMSADIGLPARGVEYSLRAAVLAQELDYPLGVAIAFSNMTASLYAMGLYRETISVALRISKRFRSNPQCASAVSASRANMASAALAMQHYALSAEAARESCEALGLPKDGQGILNRVATENTWMRGAIGLGDRPTVDERLKMIRSLAESFSSPRLDLNKQLAEAAYEIFVGNLTIAVAKLLDLLKRSKSVPALYRDNLVLLVKAYEKGNDHAGALLYLGELVEFLGKSQVSAVARQLELIRERIQTPMPGKDDVRAVIMAIQKTPSAHREEIDVPEPLYRDAMERLAVSAELREDTLGRHAYRVGRLTGLLANSLGYGHKYTSDIELAARLHDIGKLGIPDGLLMKPGKLTDAEFSVMQRHTTIGAKILQQCTHPAFRLAEVIALNHHEKWDGSGYPKGLKGEEIPEVARIATLADVYDALTHVRSYKHAWTHAEAVIEIERTSGTHFEPRMVTAFIALVNHLRRAHGEAFDDYLSEGGKHSTFIQARDQMHQMLNEMEPLSPGELL
ncbi:MAG: HD domain-containing phosphohydrolase [Casimicrobium sp.]